MTNATRSPGRRHALVFGGSGVVGGAVVARLSSLGVRVTFSYFRQAERARALAAELSQTAVAVDLRDSQAVEALVAALTTGDDPPDLFIHCAGALGPRNLADVADSDWQTTLSVNCQAALWAIRGLIPAMRGKGSGDLVLVGALAGSQSLPLPGPLAASQGMLAALVMSLGRELGPLGIRTNLVTLGLLGQGLSSGLDPRVTQDYLRFSALRRLGTPTEAARAITWLALENTYMNGKVMSVNGGI